MESHGPHCAGKSRTYRIVVRSELGRRFAPAFEGMEMSYAGGETVLTGEVADQAHLHGILDHINALGLELVSVQRVPEAPRITTGRAEH